MLRDPITIDQTIDFLNGLLATDAVAITSLVSARVGCNEDLAAHPTVQVSNELTVGMLGILNGMFGTITEGEHKGFGPITAVIDGSRIVRFERTLA